MSVGTHLFVKVPRPGDSEGTFSVEVIPLSSLPKDTTSELAQSRFYAENVKQESCECQHFQSSGLTRTGNNSAVPTTRRTL